MSQKEVISLLESLAGESVLVPGRLEVRASRDPEDDKFLASAIEAEAEYVVSGDNDLLDLKMYRGVRIVTPAKFLRTLREAIRPS